MLLFRSATQHSDKNAEKQKAVAVIFPFTNNKQMGASEFLCL